MILGGLKGFLDLLDKNITPSRNIILNNHQRTARGLTRSNENRLLGFELSNPTCWLNVVRPSFCTYIFPHSHAITH